MGTQKIFAGVELGGTKILCRVVDENGTVLEDRRFVTSTPTKAVEDICDCVASAALTNTHIAGIGVASFGPIVVDPNASDYGRLLATPKPGWSGFDLRAALYGRLHGRITIDTDVNAAALAEQQLGAGRGLANVAYVTVGTGIGGGLTTDAGTFKGGLHPEIGHVRLRRRAGDDVRSCCPFHDDCAEGLAAGPAIARRLDTAITLEDSPQLQSLIGAYLGDLMATLVLAWAPQRIVCGGGVLGSNGLLPKIGEAMHIALANYGPSIARSPEYLVPAHFEHAGLEGALIMARKNTI